MLQDYRLNFDMLSYSEIKCFSKCPRLYFEQYIKKTYQQEDQDYFVYGHVVDALVTQPWTLDERFSRVSRKTNGTCLASVEELRTVQAKIAALEPLASANKTKARSLEKCLREQEEIQARIKEIQSVEGKVQVTNAIWENAHDTAEAIKRNPFYAERVAPLLETTREAFQQMIYDAETHSKGILDILVLPKEGYVILDAFRDGKLSKEEARTEAGKLGEIQGFIADIKTTFSMQKLAPVDYAAQLGYYQLILSEILGVKLPCYAIVGDKDPSVKVAQDFAYSQDVLDFQVQKLLSVKSIMLKSQALFNDTQDEKWYPAAKTFRGKRQECMSCSVCRERPYSSGAPYQITMRDLADYSLRKR